tara:strand:- start:471 stop:692 length:222 start_codon:yes stop_codon:yes gene_type:complete
MALLWVFRPRAPEPLWVPLQVRLPEPLQALRVPLQALQRGLAPVHPPLRTQTRKSAWLLPAWTEHQSVSYHSP